jgi:hypothetical protein
MKKLKFISAAFLSVALASCVTFSTTEKKQIMDFVKKPNVSNNRPMQSDKDLLQQTVANYQFLKEIYGLEILLSNLETRPTQRGFELAKEKIEKISSCSEATKSSLSLEERQYYNLVVEKYKLLYRKFILNN